MGEPLKILHLEDTAGDAELINRELKRAGLLHDIMVVDNSADYSKALFEYNPCIILSDHSLPFFTSIEAFAILSQSGLNIPFILVTSTVSEEFAVEIIKMGAADYILKDRLQRLPTAITNALEKKRLATEHEKFLQEVIANETLMNDAQLLAHFGSFNINLLQNTVTLSPEAYNIFGTRPGEAQASYSILSVDNGNIPEKISVSIGDIHIELSNNKNSYTLIDKNGKLKFLSAEYRTEKDINGQAVAIKGFLYDVTRIKSAENLLQRSEANLKTIFETTDTGYIHLGTDKKIISFNKQASIFIEEQTGLLLQENQFIFPYVAEARVQFMADILKKVLDGENVSYETSLLNKDGSTKWYYSRWLGIKDHGNSTHGVIIAISDVTARKLADIERKKIANDLIVRNNALEQFSYIVSHNLRAPVANIIGIANILCQWGATQPETVQQFTSALQTSTLSLDNVVKDLNGILRMTQKVKEANQIVYFQQLVEDIKTELAEAIHRNNVTIKTNFFDCIYAYSVKSHLYNIFYNLINNAVNFKSEARAPFIEIKSSITGKNLSLKFTDNGRGIDLNVFGNKIFGLYQRFDTSVEGKGMGLCIVKTLTESLGGSIVVNSAVNSGTAFTIQLPFDPRQ